MPPSVVVLDYGSGNLRSAQRALERAGARVQVSADADVALAADGLVIPGVGAFAACMQGLLDVGGPETVRTRLRHGRPVLGICVGRQILFEYGVEHGRRTAGVGLLPGGIEALVAPVLPHMGWNTVTTPAGTTLFHGVEHERFYFVHSFAARVDGGDSGGAPDHQAPDHEALDHGRLLTTATHGQNFVAAVEDGALSATQFHPEKSGDAGARVLANWVAQLDESPES